MGLVTTIDTDLTQAIKRGDSAAVSVLRLLKAAITNAQKQGSQVELKDGDIVGLIAREIKQRKDAIVQLEKANRPQLVAAEKSGIELLQHYLPQAIPHQELQGLVTQAIKTTGATSLQDMGKVMAALMPQVKGRADGTMVSQLVKTNLGAATE